MSRKKEVNNKGVNPETKEIVKYNNVLTDLALRKFNAVDLDIFMTLCSVCKERGVNDIVIPLSQLKTYSHYTKSNRMTQTEEEKIAEQKNLPISPKSFIGALKQTNRKILGLNLELDNNETPGVYIQFNLFQTFIIDEKRGTLTVKVNEDFAYILNELSSDFTKFDLAEFVALKSFYAKETYRQLKRYKDTGLWWVSSEDFRKILCIPDGYSQSDIDGRVLAPVVNELTPLFENLDIQKQYSMKGLRGRPSVSAYKFLWKPSVKQKGSWQALPKTNSGFICPYCNEPLVEKVLNGSNAWCHPDNFSANKKSGSNKCVRIFNSVDEIYKAKELLLKESEIVEPEGEYIDQVKDITAKFLDTLSEKKKSLTPDEIKKKYGDIDEIEDMVTLCKLDFSEEDDDRLKRDLERLQKLLIKHGCPEDKAEEYSHRLI